jgi:glycolate oxidase FAD binding subunit
MRASIGFFIRSAPILGGEVMPDTYVGKLNAAVKLENKSVLRTEIENKLKQVFDPRGVFQ